MNNVNNNISLQLANKYHQNDSRIMRAADELSQQQFLRLFVTAHGMQPVGDWRTHTYVCFKDSNTGKKHFFLAPIPKEKNTKAPKIELSGKYLTIDEHSTDIYLQSIPHTTPFWYFHYDPNKNEHPYYSLTLNLSPDCLERCVLCAGAKTGRVNNGLKKTLDTRSIIDRIFLQHPKAKEQLDCVAIVTGCFHSFSELNNHLSEVRSAISEHCSPSTYRVLEHNVVNYEDYDKITGELGYDVFVTMECFDQNIRNIALNGKVGRKGRDSREFLEIIYNYASYLEANQHLGKQLVRVTYLMGLDSLETSEYFFKELAAMNDTFQHAKILPWLSIFTAYSDAMKVIQNKNFGLRFVLDAMDLCNKYFDPNLLQHNSGGTSEGYARGLF